MGILDLFLRQGVFGGGGLLGGGPRPGGILGSEGNDQIWNEQPTEMFDPRARQKAALKQGLLYAGAGLAGGQGWGQGLSQGLLGMGQGMQQGREAYMQDAAFNMEMEKQRQAAERDRGLQSMYGGLLGVGGPTAPMPSSGPLAAGAPPVGTNPGGLMPVGDAGTDPMGSQLAQLLGPQRFQIAQAMYAAGDYDGLNKLIIDATKPESQQYDERMVPVAGGTQYQKEFSRDGGKTWEPFGDPYDIRAASGGSDITFAPTMTNGVPASDLQKPTLANLEQDLLATTGGLQSAQAIVDRYVSDYQTYLGQIDFAKMAVLDKAGQLTPEDQAKLADYTQFKASAAELLSNVVKERAGTAMTPQEAERILAWIPNPGTGMFDGDSPTQFKAKLDRYMEDMRKVQIRLYYMRTQGITDISQAPPLDSMPDIVQKRGIEIEQQFKAQGLEGDALRNAVRQTLATEFGMVGG